MKPLAALTRPSWLFALGILFLNDHVWKRGSLIPHLVTGKISDFAGLFIAPALLAALLAVRSRRGVALCHLAVAVGFALVKTLPAATHLYDAALSLLIPSKGVTDPTDLLALPMVLVSWRVLVPEMHGDGRKFWLVIGCMLCVADEPEDNPLVFTIVNHTDTALNVSVNPLSDAVSLDRAKFLSIPDRLFTRPLFTDNPRLRLGAGQTRNVSESTPGMGRYLWIEADALPPVLLAAADASDLGSVELAIARAPDGTPEWIAHSAILHVDPQAHTESGGRCLAPDDKLSTWSPLLAGDWNVEARAADDGCLDVTLWPDSGIEHHWRLCIPAAAWPFTDGDRVRITGNDDTEVRVLGESEHLVVVRGETLPTPDEDVPLLQLDNNATACTGMADACGTVWVNVPLVGSLFGAPLAIDDKVVFPTQTSNRIAVNPTCSQGPDHYGFDLGFAIVHHLAPSPSPSP